MSHHHYEDVINTNSRKNAVELVKEKDQYRPYSSDYFINKEIEFFLSFELNEDEDNSIGFKYGKEKEMILEDEKLKETKAWQLSNDLKEINEQINWLQKEAIKKKLELDKLCTHEKIREEYRNYPGGYLDRAEYWTDYFCDVCGAKIDEKVKYGGFG